jgi:hypothetical protein
MTSGPCPFQPKRTTQQIRKLGQNQPSALIIGANEMDIMEHEDMPSPTVFVS